MADEAVLAELRAIREELVRLRLQQARAMAMLMAIAAPMTTEAYKRVLRDLMALDDGADGGSQ